MDEDLELDSYRFNIALTCFYVPYIVFEVSVLQSVPQAPKVRPRL